MLRGFLRLVYELLRILIWICFGIYYPFHKFRNKETLRFKGPGILVSNHPSTLTDPLHVLIRMPRQSFLLANAGLFKSAIGNFLLTHLYCIPISRPGMNEDNKRVNNQDSFAKSNAHLVGGGILYIAPEGGSYVGRNLRRVKTGTARIALQAEASTNFTAGLKIYPVGLNYDNAGYCGSGIFLEAGEPIDVSAWKTAYEADPRQAAIDLTAKMREHLEAALLAPVDEEQDQLLYRLETIQRNDEPLSVEAHYDRIKHLVEQLKILQVSEPEAYQQLATDAAQYREQLRSHQLTDSGISREAKGLFTLITLLGWPIWLYGRLNNALPYDIPRWLERKLELYVGYKTTVKILAGMILFPLFYWLQFLLADWLLPSPWEWIYLISLPTSGVLAWLYARHVLPRWEGYRWRQFKRQEAGRAKELADTRAALQTRIQELTGK